MKTALLTLAVLVLCAAGVRAEAEPRTALVMGVWEYTDPNFPALPGIEDDVKNMSAKLKELGFEVTTVKNPTLSQAKEAVDAFSATLKTRKGVGCFYFSGHGCEHEGRNFLIPRGTHIARRADVDDEALSAQRVLNGMEDAGTGVNIVFLDCCRNGLTKGAGSGLAAMQASGTFIGFATASTKEANAGQGGSLYTQALLKYLGTPGMSLTDVHTLVTHEVKQVTTEAGSPQIPFQYSGLDNVFMLVPGGVQPTMVKTSPEPRPVDAISTIVPGMIAGNKEKDAGKPFSPAPTAGASPFTNTLGMKFVPVPGTKVLFCIHETRKRDYAAFARETTGLDGSWKKTLFKGVLVSEGDDHPVVNVSWKDATAFCRWLARKEGRSYRLPTDHEWSCAVGIGTRESEFASPESKDGKLGGVYPWGSAWPPPAGTGNFADSTLKRRFPDLNATEDYSDSFVTTAPVMSFAPNNLGIYDLSGNVWEYCEDWYNHEQKYKVLRGGSWGMGVRDSLLSAVRYRDTTVDRDKDFGFRCVLEAGGG